MTTDVLRDAFVRVWSALVAFVLVLLALVFDVLAVLLLMLTVAADSMRRFVVELVRVLIAGALVTVVVWAWPVAWQAFGGDVAAMIPASMLVVLPVALSFARRAGWPGLLAAVLVISVLAVVLASVTHPALVAFVVLVAVFVHFTTRRLHHA